MYHELLSGIEKAIETPGPSRVVVNNEDQRMLAETAIPELAQKLGRSGDDIGVHLTEEHPVGTVFSSEETN